MPPHHKAPDGFHGNLCYILLSALVVSCGNEASFLAAEDTFIKMSPPCPTCTTTLFGPQEASPKPAAEQAEDIFAKSLAAYGGQDRVLALKQGVYEYLVESSGSSAAKPIAVKTYFKDETYFRSEARGDNLDAITILNKDHGWVKVGETTLSLSRKEIEPLRTGMVAQLRPDLLLLSFPKRRFTGQAQENGRSLELVEVSGFLAAEYVRGRLSFDAATSLIAKYEYEIERELPKGKGIVKGEEHYLRYGESEGIKYPLEIRSRQGQKTSRLTVKSVSFSGPMSEALFQDPTTTSGTQ